MADRKTDPKTKNLQSNIEPAFRFKGNYYLVGQVTKPDSNGNLVSVLHISDATNQLKIFCRDQLCISGDLRPNSLVHVEAQLVKGQRGVYWQGKYIEPANFSLIGRHLTYLPSALCPVDGGTIRLIELVSRISDANLRVFVQKVIMHPHVAVQYLTCPANLYENYNFAGGLLAEAIQTGYAITMYSSLTQEERDLGLVAALIGNIGLTQTFTLDLKETALGTMIDGRKLTIEMCRNELSQLHQVAPDISAKLQNLLTFTDTKPTHLSDEINRLIIVVEACRTLPSF